MQARRSVPSQDRGTPGQSRQIAVARAAGDEGSGQGTRDRLLDAAVQLITEVGRGAVTTRKIADRAGVPFGVVHYHFSSVPDLLIDAEDPSMLLLAEAFLAATREERLRGRLGELL